MNLHAQIVDGIKTLLHRQDYVVIPHFGGFVTQVHFSKLLIDKNLLTPPGKIISFNKQLRQNDGVLTLWLKEELNISAEESLKHISEFSDYCSQVLQTKRRLNLENLGFFYLDLENNICFEPKNDSNYLLDSFGLSAVILNELPEIVIDEKKETIFIDRTIETVKQEIPVKRKRNLRPLAYIALGGSILFFSLAALVTINKSEGPLLSGIFSGGATKTYKPIAYTELVLAKTETESKAYVPNSEGIAVINITNNKNIAVAMNEEAVSSNKKAKLKTSHNYNSSKYAGKFQIVLGCFSVRGNAEKMVRKLKSNNNVNAGISGINSKGMHVVSCAGFDTKDSALTFLQQVKANFPNAWIKSEN